MSAELAPNRVVPWFTAECYPGRLAAGRASPALPDERSPDSPDWLGPTRARLVVDVAGIRVVPIAGPTWERDWDSVSVLWTPDRTECVDGRAVVLAVLTGDGELARLVVPTREPRRFELDVRAVARATGTAPSALDRGPHLAVVAGAVVLLGGLVAVLLLAAGHVIRW